MIIVEHRFSLKSTSWLLLHRLADSNLANHRLKKLAAMVVVQLHKPHRRLLWVEGVKEEVEVAEKDVVEEREEEEEREEAEVRQVVEARGGEVAEGVEVALQSPKARSFLRVMQQLTAKPSRLRQVLVHPLDYLEERVEYFCPEVSNQAVHL